jgi:hypothetical protein
MSHSMAHARRDRSPFVTMPVWWAMAAAEATGTRTYRRSARRQFETHSMTFPQAERSAG